MEFDIIKENLDFVEKQSKEMEEQLKNSVSKDELIHIINYCLYYEKGSTTIQQRIDGYFLLKEKGMLTAQALKSFEKNEENR
jgi:hypothetical protein